MDSLRGIPVEYELDAFSMPSTGTTSCHPKNWLCRSERNSALDHMEIAPTLLPKYQIQNYTVTLNTIPPTSSNTRCHLNISLRHFVSILTSLNSTSLAAPKATHIPCCKKTYPKNTFRLSSILLLLQSTFSIPNSVGCPRGVMVKAMNCGIVVREFVLQSRYYVHFRANTLGKGMNPLILPPAK